MTTLLLVRHADIDLTGAVNDQTPLNAVGRARATALRDLLASAGVEAIFASPALRTQQTVQPLADHLHLTIQVPQGPAGTPANLVQRVLADHAVGVALIAGHSNTVPQMIQAAGGQIPEIDEGVFDNLFVVTVFALGTASVITLKYGKTT
jgi:phosphohistidine phosphatase SixA